MTRHRPAPLVLRWWLRATGFQGITMPWRAAYYLHWPAPHRLVAHEQAHIRQIERYGAVGFLWRYAIGLIRHGYWNHPMEIEAREAEYEALFDQRPL